MYRIFLVEDEETIAKTIKMHLEKWDYEVTMALDFANIMTEFTQCAPQLVILDIKLPFYNGYYWCTEIRKVSKLPILFLSSMGENMNIVMAMNMGGDDFIAKPFDLEVLTAKIQALLRRSYDFTDTGNVLEQDGAFFYPLEGVLLYQDNRVELTRNEIRILQTLMENKGRIISRDDLMVRLWESDSYVDENTLSVNVNRLRKKLAQAGLQDFISTRKGIGYQIG